MNNDAPQPSALSGWFHHHARSILFLLTMLALAGAAASLGLPVALFPQVSFPRIEVSIDAGDQPAERMALQVTSLVEEAVRSIPGVRSIRSSTSRGSANVAVNFNWGENMTTALLQVNTQISKLLPRLPPGTTFDVQRRDPTVFPVMAYSLTSDSQSPIQLRDLAQYKLRPVLSTITGVAKVGVQGGAVEEFRVIADPAKLQTYHLTVADLATSLAAQNTLEALGKLEDHDKLYLLIADSQLTDRDAIGQTVLRSGTNGIVRVTDVATVEIAASPQWTRVTADGHDAVLLQVYQQPSGNTVQIASDIKRKLADLQSSIPPSVHIANWYDQSELITDSARSVRDAVLIGVALAGVVLLFFLRNWKVTAIAMITVPSVLASTILLLYVLGMSFNIMTLGAMAAAVGLIIDDAIVMVEHIIRRLRESGAGQSVHSPRLTVAAAAQNFTRPLAGSSAATIIIFAPLAFLSGVTGAFFKALSLTMAAALILSFLTSWLAVPVLAARLLGSKDAAQKEGGFFSDILQKMYAPVMRLFLRVPAVGLLIVGLFLIGGYLAYQRIGSGFMPPMDEGGFILDYVAKPGTSLAETDRLLRKVEDILRSTSEVETYSRRTGLQLGGGLTEANTGDFFIRLKPLPRRNIETVMDDVRSRVEHNVPGMTIETAQLMEDLIGDLTAVPQPIEIKLYSDDPKALAAAAPHVADEIGKIPGIVEIKNGIVLAGDAINIHVDPTKAAIEGVDAETVNKQLTDLLSGNVATQTQRGPKLVDVRVWVPKASRATDLDLNGLSLRAPDGHLFPLTRVATLTTEVGQPEINRDDLKRMVAVTARIAGRDLGSAVADVQRVLNQPGVVPAGVYYSLGGLYQQQQIAFRGLTVVLIAAVILVFLLLLFLYESFRVAFSLLCIPLLALAGVIMGLWLTGTELNITSMMGMTMVVGIVTEVSIFYYSEFHELPDGPKWKRFIDAGKNRMRPISMTTAAAILALLPLALNIGGGTAMQRPLAIAIISGLIVQVPLVLTVLPVLLRLVGVSKRIAA